MAIVSTAIDFKEVSETGEDARSEASEARSEVDLDDSLTSEARSIALLAEAEASEARSEADLGGAAGASAARSIAVIAEDEASEARSECDLVDGEASEARSECDIDATDSVKGRVELATITEVNTGTDATRSITPDALAGSVLGEKGVCIAAVESDTSVAVADGKIPFTVPLSMDGMNLVDVIASVHTKGITGTTNIQIRRRRAGSDADMLSTLITIGDEFFASDEVIDGANDDILDGDQIYIDVDAIHSGTAPLGLSVVLTFRKV